MASFQDSEDIEIRIKSISEWQVADDQTGQGISLETTRGTIYTLLHNDPYEPTAKGIIWVSGASGGFDGPARKMYSIISNALAPDIASLRINYRFPGNLTECVMDTLSAVSFMAGIGHTDLVLVGHSFGGAVVIQAAQFSDLVKGVVGLSSQTQGATGVAQITPRPILLMHGEDDNVLSSDCSELIFKWANEPKEIVILPSTGHSLEETAPLVIQRVQSWVIDHLGK